jgi:molybdopterin-binding protein
MKLSARNVLRGKVKEIVEGSVTDEVVVELPGGAEMVSIITKSSAQTLGLKPGAEVYAIINATDVILGTPWRMFARVSRAELARFGTGWALAQNPPFRTSDNVKGLCPCDLGLLTDPVVA